MTDLQGQVSRLQAERDRLDVRASTAERDLAAATSELEEARLSLKVKLEEQQNQFRAIEEEQYSEWEKRVCLCILAGAAADAASADKTKCKLCTRGKAACMLHQKYVSVEKLPCSRLC